MKILTPKKAFGSAMPSDKQSKFVQDILAKNPLVFLALIFTLVSSS